MKAPAQKTLRRVLFALVALVVIGLLAWSELRTDGLGDGFASGNGRIEATEIDVATKLGGRIREISVDEGDFVQPGQVIARMDTEVLEAQLNQARAQVRQAENAILTAQALVTQRESEKATAEAVVLQRRAELTAAQKRHQRTETLVGRNAMPRQLLDAAQASVLRLQADIRDSELKTDRVARVQYRVAQPGEVLGAGGKLLNLVDLADIYMTFFLPERQAGRVAMGSEARLVIDAAPQYVIPARITYVASVAQFTPKTVETESEREKLMFRVKARIDPDLLRKHMEQVKTGLPGVAYLKLDADAEWPAHLQINVGQ